MKKITKIIITLSLLIIASCSDKGVHDSKKSIEALKKVSFRNVSNRVISEEKTNDRISDGKNGFKYIYKKKVESSVLVSPLKSPLYSNNDIIYPGSILRGESFLKGSYDPLTLQEEYEPVTISITLKGELKPFQKILPTPSASRTFFNDVLTDETIDFDSVSSLFEFESQMVISKESFKKSLKIHTKTEVFNNLIHNRFNYDEVDQIKSKKSYVMVSFSQKLFNASMDSQHYSKWLKSGFSLSDLGEYEPVYVSSVDYGRMGYMFIESSESQSKTQEMVSNAISSGLGFTKNSKHKEDKTKLTGIFKSGKIKVFVNGGNASSQTQISTIEGFFNFVKVPKPDELVKTSVPISFKIRRIIDNTEVLVFNSYTEIIKEIK